MVQISLRDLYQEVILDHNQSPRNYGELETYTVKRDGDNPLCGDNIILYLIIENDIVVDIKFKGEGCAITMASSSMMTEFVMGKKLEEVEELFEQFRAMLTEEDVGSEGLGKLKVFEGVKEFPARVKCATLSWHTMHNAIKKLE